MLITLVYMVMPRGVPAKMPNPDKVDTFSTQAENMSSQIPEGQGHDAYVIIFDAGSTGQTLSSVVNVTGTNAKLCCCKHQKGVP